MVLCIWWWKYEGIVQLPVDHRAWLWANKDVHGWFDRLNRFASTLSLPCHCCLSTFHRSRITTLLMAMIFGARDRFFETPSRGVNYSPICGWWIGRCPVNRLCWCDCTLYPLYERITFRTKEGATRNKHGMTFYPGGLSLSILDRPFAHLLNWRVGWAGREWVDE